MSGNEILLNLDNHENLSNSELVSGLLELGKRDPGNEHEPMDESDATPGPSGISSNDYQGNLWLYGFYH